MPLNRHSSGLLLLVLAAGVGYLLVALPPVVIEHYKSAAEISSIWGYAYLAAVGLGGALMAGALGWIALRLWRNTRKRRLNQERRSRDPSQLSLAEREQELRDNLTASGTFAEGSEVPSEVREAIRQQMAGLEEKLQTETLEIVAFGTISSGKSSLLNALAGRELFKSDPLGGTTLARSEVPWPGGDRVVLVDTPGLAEIQGEARAAEAAAAAKDADLVLFVVDGPLKSYEFDLLRKLSAMEKRMIICLNKEDWYSASERDELLNQITTQVASLVRTEDVVSVQAGPATRRRVRVLPGGGEEVESTTARIDIAPLAERMLEIVQGGRRDLVLANLLLQSRGLVEQAKDRVRASLDARANELVGKYMWAAGGAAAVNPIPLLDVAGGSAISVKMVLDLARLYRREIDIDTAVNLLSNLTKNLVAMLGVTAATPAITSMVASLMKTAPGVGTIAGGLVQGLVQALVTRWIGKVFITYFREGMTEKDGGLAELAREKWEEVTRPKELIKLVQAGRRQLQGNENE